ncbi:MAG: DUF5689 domain-containing protein [Bacteroidales bacterium]
MKKINKKPVILTLLFSLALIMFSCVDDEFDTPSPRTIPEGDPITIQEVKDLFDAQGDYEFTTDKSIYAVVTMDDKSGNIYRTAYIQDETGAIALHMASSGGLYQGDSLRLQLNGLKIGQYNELFQIDAPDGNGFTMDDYITKLDTKVETTPENTTILDIVSNMDYFQGRLVKIDSVQFIASDTSETYADGENQITENRTIVNVEGDDLIVRTSGYASFADEPIPNGSGSLVAIVGQYGNTPQLYIRSIEEVEMDNERLGGSGGGNAQGTGTFEDPYNAAAGIVNQGENNVWVEGFIVGVYETQDGSGTQLDDFAPSFTAPFNTPYNIIIADTDNETNISNCLIIQLPAGEIRDVVNLVDNEVNLGKSVKFVGNLTSYFGESGLKDLTGYWMDGDGINPEDPVVVEILGTSTTVTTLNENFESATENTNFAENGWLNANKEGERYWQGKEFESNKYAQSTAYGATSENIEMWLVSPGIELSTAKKLNFDTNTGYYKHEGLTVWVSTDFDGNNSNLFTSTWTEITDQATIAVGPDNAYGTWTNSDDIDLSSYSGTIYILFKYVGDNDINTTTFQVDNVQVTDL